MSLFTVKGENIILSGDPKKHTYSVKCGSEEWVMSEKPYVIFEDGNKVEFPAPSYEGYFKTGIHEGIEAVYSDFGGYDITLRTKVAIEVVTEDVLFLLETEKDEFRKIKRISFPAPFDYGKDFGDSGETFENNLPRCYTVLPLKQGSLIPADEEYSLENVNANDDTVMVYAANCYLPLYSQVRNKGGYLAIFETPFDAAYQRRGHKIAPIWKPSLGVMAYPRKLLFRFFDNCDHNVIAKSYREYVRDHGLLSTLKEKIAKNPKVEKIFGAPIIDLFVAWHCEPESNYYVEGAPEKNDRYTSFYDRAEQLKEYKQKGLKKAYVHLDGWGSHGYDNYHPSPLPPHEKAGGIEGMKHLAEVTVDLGYTFGIHDQYRDYYHNGPDFSFDNAVRNVDGSYFYGTEWPGGKQTFLCSSVARDYVRRNYRMLEKYGINIEGAYLDVFSSCPPDECINPAHPVTREQGVLYRRECLDFLTARGIVASSEEVLDCYMPSQVLCHHAPFFTVPLDSDGVCPGTPIPFVNLVYHDCIVIPWMGRKGKKGGFGIPKTDCGYTYAFLNAGPIHISNWSHNTDTDQTEIDEANEVCALSGKLALTSMDKHEFLTADRRIQRTTFSDGTTVTVNLDTDEIKVTD